MKIDFQIIGQGIAGSLLAWELHQRGFSVQIWDEGKDETSSKRAGGLYNPITGRKMVKTWMADELFLGLEDYYQDIEKKLGVRFLYPKPIYRPFFAMEDQNDWLAKWEDDHYKPFISEIAKPQAIEGLQDPFGGLIIKNCGYVDVPLMLDTMRSYFSEQGLLIPHRFEAKKSPQAGEKIIYCEGPFVTENPYWNDLPFKPVRGEVMDIHCDLPTDKVYNRGVFILPKEGYFRVGSTYDHKVLTFEPQESGIEELKMRLGKLYTGNYEILRVSAGVRPATFDRKPFIGWHPENKGVGIFNGFGTKGVSLVPYFSKLFVDSIQGKCGIHPEANVSRVF